MKEVSKKNNSIISEFGASFDIDENETVAFYLASTVQIGIKQNDCKMLPNCGGNVVVDMRQSNVYRSQVQQELT